MKKLVLVMFCAFLIVLLIAFNYLLWDRENKVRNIENLESSYASRNASIDALGREIKMLEDENKQLKEEIGALESENKLLQSDKAQMQQEISRMSGVIGHKQEVLDKLAQYADLKEVEAPIRKWAESIDKGDYETAYNLLKRKMEKEGETTSKETFSEIYRKTVKSLKIKSIELYKRETIDETDGDILFKVLLEVKKAADKEITNAPFADGINEMYISIEYDKDTDEWVIANISANP